MNTTNRDDFSPQTKRTVASRAGYRCSSPDCRRATVGPSHESPTSIASVGVAAHISAAASGPGARRHDPSMSSESRSDISNAIWLCANHATLIDRDDILYTREKLKQMKLDHEAWCIEELRKGTAKITILEAGVNTPATDRVKFDQATDLANLLRATSSQLHGIYGWKLKPYQVEFTDLRSIDSYIRNVSPAMVVGQEALPPPPPIVLNEIRGLLVTSVHLHSHRLRAYRCILSLRCYEADRSDTTQAVAWEILQQAAHDCICGGESSAFEREIFTQVLAFRIKRNAADIFHSAVLPMVIRKLRQAITDARGGIFDNGTTVGLITTIHLFASVEAIIDAGMYPFSGNENALRNHVKAVRERFEIKSFIPPNSRFSAISYWDAFRSYNGLRKKPFQFNEEPVLLDDLIGEDYSYTIMNKPRRIIGDRGKILRTLTEASITSDILTFAETLKKIGGIDMDPHKGAENFRAYKFLGYLDRQFSRHKLGFRADLSHGGWLEGTDLAPLQLTGSTEIEGLRRWIDAELRQYLDNPHSPREQQPLDSTVT